MGTHLRSGLALAVNLRAQAHRERPLGEETEVTRRRGDEVEGGVY